MSSKRTKFDIPIRIWLKIFAFYGCEVWGPLTNQEFTKWEKHQSETPHADFSKTPNNACRAELC